MSDLVCEHGSFRRKCEICERDGRIKELEVALQHICNMYPEGFICKIIAERVLRGEEGGDV